MPALFAAALLTPLSAFADEPNCPPGSWFCADPNVDQPQVAPDEDQDSATPEEAPALPKARPQQRAEEEEDEDTPEVEQDRGPVRRPRVVVVDEPGGYATPPNVVIVTRRHPHARAHGRRLPPPQLTPVQAKPQPRLFTKWGFNLRVEGAAMGDGANVDAGMGGIGMSLRYRPVPAFAFDLGVDVIGGKDFNGFSRIETPVSLNGMIYVNPRSRVQFYLLGGAHLSHAEVRSDSSNDLLRPTDDGRYGADYNYFGGQGGAGLEFRLGRRVGLSFDVLGFIRKRTDSGRQPEYVDASSGQTTNTSGGVLMRGGINFWW